MGRTCSLEPEEFLHELGSDEGIRVFTQAWVQLVARRDDVAHALDAHELDRRAGGVCRLPAVDNGVGERWVRSGPAKVSQRFSTAARK